VLFELKLDSPTAVAAIRGSQAIAAIGSTRRRLSTRSSSTSGSTEFVRLLGQEMMRFGVMATTATTTQAQVASQASAAMGVYIQGNLTVQTGVGAQMLAVIEPDVLAETQSSFIAAVSCASCADSSTSIAAVQVTGSIGGSTDSDANKYDGWWDITEWPLWVVVAASVLLLLVVALFRLVNAQRREIASMGKSQPKKQKKKQKQKQQEKQQEKLQQEQQQQQLGVNQTAGFGDYSLFDPVVQSSLPLPPSPQLPQQSPDSKLKASWGRSQKKGGLSPGAATLDAQPTSGPLVDRHPMPLSSLPVSPSLMSPPTSHPLGPVGDIAAALSDRLSPGMKVLRTDRGIDYPAEIRSIGVGADQGRCDLVYADGKIEAGVPMLQVSRAGPTPSHQTPGERRIDLPFAQREVVNFNSINSALASNAAITDVSRARVPPNMLI
jgi:hypothetical protein